jgi:hypothetical protein
MEPNLKATATESATPTDTVWTPLDLTNEEDRLRAFNSRWQDTAFGRRWHSEVSR